jgi:isocitrate dehydrogenase
MYICIPHNPIPLLIIPQNTTSKMPSHSHIVSSKIHRIACIPGDGIGVDITEAAIRVLNVLAAASGDFSFDFTTFDWSSKNYLSRGYYMPPDGIAQLKKYDAIYFGAVGWPGKYSFPIVPCSTFILYSFILDYQFGE